jgi:hypothetical protein
MNAHMLNRHFLLPACAALAVQCHSNSTNVRDAFAAALRKPWARLQTAGLEPHSPAAAFHSCVVRRPRLCGNHALDLIGGLECPQADDCDEELPVAIFLRLAGREPAG